MFFVTRQGKLGFLTGEKNRRDVCLCMSQPVGLPFIPRSLRSAGRGSRCRDTSGRGARVPYYIVPA